MSFARLLLRDMVQESADQALEVLALGQPDMAIMHLREAIEQIELMKLQPEETTPQQITLDV